MSRDRERRRERDRERDRDRCGLHQRLLLRVWLPQSTPFPERVFIAGGASAHALLWRTATSPAGSARTSASAASAATRCTTPASPSGGPPLLFPVSQGQHAVTAADRMSWGAGVSGRGRPARRAGSAGGGWRCRRRWSKSPTAPRSRAPRGRLMPRGRPAGERRPALLGLAFPAEEQGGEVATHARREYDMAPADDVRPHAPDAALAARRAPNPA